MRRSLLSPFLLVPLMAQAPDAAWREGVLKARREKDAEFRAGATSPLAGLQRLILEGPGGIRVGAEGLGVVQGTDADALVRVHKVEGAWRWATADQDLPVKAGDLFALGRFHVQAYPSPDRLMLLVFDPERPAVKDFQGLRYFPPDPAYRVRARVERLPGTEAITLVTSRNLEKRFTRAARLHVRLGGRDVVLTAYTAEGSPGFFIPFTDRTTGDTTYDVGRFLELPAPSGDTLILDFNAAFNPLCNYADIYNCPIPPKENRLDVAVRAGEQAYPHP